MKMPSIESIIALKKEREQRLQRRSMIIAVLIISFSLLWLYLTNQIVADKRNQIVKSNDQIVQLESKIDSLNQILGNISNLSNYLMDVDFLDIKPLYGVNSKVAEILVKLLMIKNSNPKFKYEATAADSFINENEYSSPSLMIHVLSINGILRNGVSNRVELEAFFKSNVVTNIGQYQIGDVIFYETGYVMMYIQLENQLPYKEFCIGMTPLGVLTLRPDFGKIIKIVRPSYH